MSKKRVPSHRVHKASGRGVVRINGKCFYTGPYGSPKAEAAYRRIVQQWEATNRSASFGDSSLTMAMVMADSHQREIVGQEKSRTQILILKKGRVSCVGPKGT